MVRQDWQCPYESATEQRHSEHIHVHVSKDYTEGCVIYATDLLAELRQGKNNEHN